MVLLLVFVVLLVIDCFKGFISCLECDIMLMWLFFKYLILYFKKVVVWLGNIFLN